MKEANALAQPFNSYIVVILTKLGNRLQMNPGTRKRLFLLLCIVGFTCLIIRYLIFNGALLATSPNALIQKQEENYRRQPGAPVLVMVFYEALCPDSKHFIMKQLVPTYEKAAPIMDIVLVPYGKATTTTNPDGTYHFECQHGITECQANIYHACAIEALKDADTKLNMVLCMIKDNRQPKDAMLRCTKQLDIETIADVIQKCYDSMHGRELLKINGEATHALRPAVNFIPTITLDGSQGKQASILKNLLLETCKIARGTEPADEICKGVL